MKQSNYEYWNYCPVGGRTNDDTPKGMLSSLYFYPFAFIFCDKQKNVRGTDLLESIKNGRFELTNYDWKDYNGNLLHPTWPAIVGNARGFVISEAAKDSIYKR